MNNSQLIGKWLINNKNIVITGAALAIGAGAVCAALWRKTQLSSSSFIEEASMKGIAEMESAKLALQKSTSSNVKAFAQQMIDDHAAVNREIQAIAARKHIHLASEAALTDKAKAFVLKHKEGQSFDEAYAEHQIKAHKGAIALFRRATKCKDADIRYFAAVTLSKLDSHLKMAQKLADSVRGRTPSAQPPYERQPLNQPIEARKERVGAPVGTSQNSGPSSYQ